MEATLTTAHAAHSTNVVGEDSSKVDLDHKEVVATSTTRTVDEEAQVQHPEDEASVLQTLEPTLSFLKTSILPTFRHHLSTFTGRVPYFSYLLEPAL